MCEIMATAVAGGQAAHDDAKGGVLNSMLAIVIDLAKLGDPASVIASVGATRAHVKSAKPAPGVAEVLTPGEPASDCPPRAAPPGSRWTKRPGPIFAPRRCRLASPRRNSIRRHAATRKVTDSARRGRSRRPMAGRPPIPDLTEARHAVCFPLVRHLRTGIKSRESNEKGRLSWRNGTTDTSPTWHTRAMLYQEMMPTSLAACATLLGHRPPDLAVPFRHADLGCGNGLTIS